jgi:hypothetical protein
LPRQNRVDPFGQLLAVSCRGTLMGNRGCLHDDQQCIRRHHRGKRWILCLLQFKSRQRSIMSPGQYTELFFLDEATGLAAGHRPCAECQRERFNLFRTAWARRNREPDAAPPSAETMDDVLHSERLDAQGGQQLHQAKLADLPQGTMVLVDGDERAWLVLDETLAPWSAGGYGVAVPRPVGVTVQVLTPPSVVSALAHGYPVGLHPSACSS